VSRRESWLSAGIVFAIALSIRAAAAAAVSFPVPENTAYYVGVARNLVEGRGLISDSLWSYGTQPLAVPRAAFEVWMPLPSLLAAIPMAILGTADWFRAAQISSVLVSATIPVLAWRLAADVAAEISMPTSRARTLAVGTGLVTAVLGPLVMFGAVPDSTAVFAALSLAACVLMTRIAAPAAPAAAAPPPVPPPAPVAAAAPPQVPARTAALVALGLILGLAALTRSEAIWLAAAWAAMAWFWTPGDRRSRARLIAVPAVVACLVFVPWLVRDTLAFGNPLPGQTISNAFFTHDYDVFAYQNQPSLSGYLSQGWPTIFGQHVAGFTHDLFNVLLVPAFPVSLVGLLALALVWRRRSLRPLAIAAGLTYVATSLFFPIATTSGTFLHAAGATYVLLAVSCLVALDALVVRIGRIRHWTRPVAWIGPGIAIAAIVPLCLVSVSTLARQGDDARTRYDALPTAMARAGVPLAGAGPVISSSPIWLAESARVRTLALPEESPESVLALAHRFGATIVIVRDDDRPWPGVLREGGSGASCFREVVLTDNSDTNVQAGSPLAGIHVFRIVC
jgi:hypothetical protein